MSNPPLKFDRVPMISENPRTSAQTPCRGIAPCASDPRDRLFCWLRDPIFYAGDLGSLADDMKARKRLSGAVAVALVGVGASVPAYSPRFVECDPAQLCGPTLAEPVDLPERAPVGPRGAIGMNDAAIGATGSTGPAASVALINGQA
jgi:hypothetical protein